MWWFLWHFDDATQLALYLDIEKNYYISEKYSEKILTFVAIKYPIKLI